MQKDQISVLLGTDNSFVSLYDDGGSPKGCPFCSEEQSALFNFEIIFF